jgi:hypothetical protein
MTLFFKFNKFTVKYNGFIEKAIKQTASRYTKQKFHLTNYRSCTYHKNLNRHTHDNSRTSPDKLINNSTKNAVSPLLLGL